MLSRRGLRGTKRQLTAVEAISLLMIFQQAQLLQRKESIKFSSSLGRAHTGTHRSEIRMFGPKPVQIAPQTAHISRFGALSAFSNTFLSESYSIGSIHG